MLSTPRTSLNSSLSKPLKVAFTRFEAKTKTDFEKFVEKLNGTYTENLTVDTNVLIATTVESHKYRGACIVGIPVVTSQWLVDSFDKGHFLPTENYRLPIFKGLTVGVLGFNKEETNELEQILKDGGGEIVTNFEKITNGKGLHLVLLKSSEIKRYETWIMGTAQSMPVVTVDWLKNCLITKQYLKPNKYAVNKPRAYDRQSVVQKLNETMAVFHQTENIIMKVLNTYDVGDETYEFLEGVVVYFYNLPDKLEKMQKKLINAGGGVYVKDLVPEVTHVIADEYTEEDVKIFRKFRQTKVVDVYWLKDCILYRRLIKADDYLTHPLPKVFAELHNSTPPNKTSSVPLVRRNTMAFPAPSFNDDQLSNSRGPSRSISYTEQKTGGLSRRNSLGPNKAPDMIDEREEFNEKKAKNDTEANNSNKEKEVNATMSQRSGKISVGKGKGKKPSMTKSLGYVFKNINIYFDSKFKELANYKKLATEHSANILDSLNVFEEIFYVVPDSQESLMMFKKNAKKNIKFVSYRWIDYCLKKKMVVRDLQEQKLIYLFPFPHKVPLVDLSNTVIYAVGLTPYDKTIIKEIIELLGAKFVYEPSKMTVLVCQDTTSKKYSEIKNGYPHVPIVTQNWVFECLQEGKRVNHQSFLV